MAVSTDNQQRSFARSLKAAVRGDSLPGTIALYIVLVPALTVLGIQVARITSADAVYRVMPYVVLGVVIAANVWADLVSPRRAQPKHASQRVSLARQSSHHKQAAGRKVQGRATSRTTGSSVRLARTEVAVTFRWTMIATAAFTVLWAMAKVLPDDVVRPSVIQQARYGMIGTGWLLVPAIFSLHVFSYWIWAPSCGQAISAVIAGAVECLAYLIGTLVLLWWATWNALGTTDWEHQWVNLACGSAAIVLLWVGVLLYYVRALKHKLPSSIAEPASIEPPIAGGYSRRDLTLDAIKAIGIVIAFLVYGWALAELQGTISRIVLRGGVAALAGLLSGAAVLPVVRGPMSGGMRNLQVAALINAASERARQNAYKLLGLIVMIVAVIMWRPPRAGGDWLWLVAKVIVIAWACGVPMYLLFVNAVSLRTTKSSLKPRILAWTGCVLSVSSGFCLVFGYVTGSPRWPAFGVMGIAGAGLTTWWMLEAWRREGLRVALPKGADLARLQSITRILKGPIAIPHRLVSSRLSWLKRDRAGVLQQMIEAGLLKDGWHDGEKAYVVTTKGVSFLTEQLKREVEPADLAGGGKVA